MVHELANSLRREWRERTPEQTLLYLAGGGLFVAGLFHLGVFLVDGGPWAGSVSWRKPATFGLSFGLTTATLGWVLGVICPPRRAARLLAVAIAIPALYEVAWVSVQRWRGVPSHFATGGLDEALFALAGFAIAIMATAVVTFAILSFGDLPVPPSMRTAIRVGLLLLVAGQGLGGAIIANAEAVDLAAAPSALALVSRLKIPHAIALHAIQVLPFLAWMLAIAPRTERERLRVVRAASTGYAGLLVVTALQA
ncbi:MAG: hypothetical protein ACRDUY_15855, partial [Nitriliruptorales bacterium]